MNHCSYVYITTRLEKVNTILKSFVMESQGNKVGKPNEHPEQHVPLWAF